MKIAKARPVLLIAALAVSSAQAEDRRYTDADVKDGAIIVAADVDNALFDVSAPVKITMPRAADRNGRPLLIKDVGGRAARARLTPVFAANDKCDGVAGEYPPLSSNYEWVIFAPTSGGWYRR